MKLFYCKIVSVNYKSGTVKIVIPDADGQVLEDVPLLAWDYHMPQDGDTVAVLAEEHNGEIEKALVLGPVYSETNQPDDGKKGLYYISLPGGAALRYESTEQIMSITVRTLSVKNLLYDTLEKKE